MKRIAGLVLIMVVVATAYVLNVLEPVERGLLDLRFRWSQETAPKDLVLVEIDEPSLRELDVWPWPRRYHGKILKRLEAAGARRVAFDIDFSSASTPQQDALFAEALDSASVPVILPVFRQAAEAPDGSMVIYESRPMDAFLKNATPAAFNVRPDDDGQVRRLFTRERWSDRVVPHYAALAAGRHGGRMTDYYVNFAIDPATVPRVSYADVLAGRFDPDLVKGREVLVGASAIQLGDMVTVPVYRALPGIELQALAYASLRKHLEIQRVPPGIVLAIVFLLLLALRPAMAWKHWHVALGTAVGISAIAVAGTWWLQDTYRLAMDTVPLLLAVVLTFLARLLSQIRRQDLRLLMQSMALRRRDAFMRLVVENTFDAIFTVDDHGLILTCNRATEEIFGQPRKSVIGKDLHALLPEVSHQGSGLDITGILALRGLNEIECRRNDGIVLSLEVSVSRIQSAGEFAIVFLTRDITERREAEKKLAQVGAAVDATTSGVMLIDARVPGSPILFVNPAFTEITGYNQEEVRMQPRGFLRGPETASDTVETLDAAIAGGTTYQGTILHYRKDGTTFWNELRAAPIPGEDGEFAYYVLILNDVTDQVETQDALIQAKDEAEVANRAKSEFLATMSHELRTPLNAIIGFSEMMISKAFGPLGSERYEEYVSDIQFSGKHLLGIINSILDLAKIESGNFKLSEDPTSLNNEVEAALRIVRERAAEKDISLDVDMPEGRIIVLADPRIVQQITLNLISNAIKFTPDGGRVSVKIGQPDEEGVRLTVTDTGIGMSDAEIDKAMQPFGQVQSSLARAYEGTGLGLPLTKRFAELHNGRLEIASAPGEGTAVTVILPPERVMPATRRPRTEKPEHADILRHKAG